MPYHKLVLTALALLPLASHGFIDPNNPPGMLPFPINIPGEYRATGPHNANGYYYCVADMYEQAPEPRDGRYDHFSYREQRALDDCFGVQLDRVVAPVPEHQMRQMVQYLQSNPIKLKSAAFNAYPTPGGYCIWRIMVYRDQWTMNLSSYIGGHHLGRPCASEQPVECTVSKPDILLHNPRAIGRVRSETGGSVVVQCNRAASVIVDVQDSSVKLRGNAGGELRSTIHVGTKTSTSVTATADPVATVSVWSTIDDLAETAGTYTGSTVITVQWD
ncbi:hypothetical protein ABIE12_000246 [Serratia sp. 509]